MKVEIKIPAMGESVTEAIISNIIKASGSMVKADEEILELETDKVNQILYAPQAGQVTFTVQLHDTVKVGQVIGFVDTDVKATAAPVATAPKAAEPKHAEASKPPAPAPAKAAPEMPKQPDAFAVRKMAPEFIASLTEPEKVMPAPTSQTSPAPSKPTMAFPASATRKRMSNLRKVIAQRLVEAKNSTAMLTTFNEVDLSKVIEIRTKEKEAFQERYGVKLGFMSFFTKAVVAALKANPAVNGMIDGDDIVTFNTYDIGIAVSTDKGLFVPVIKNCDTLSFGGIEAAIGTYAKKAREGKIAVDDMRGGSFTISNAGSFGSLLSTPILNPPQSAVLGMHNILKRPVVVNDEIVIRPMMYIALSYDHRIIDGKEAVLFLVHIKESLEDPARLLLDL
jgi:2-oxoglutarate dehydrogenase E2 component (dihydrolipoamide succinyltransferase)